MKNITWKQALHYFLEILPLLGICVLIGFLVQGIHMGIFKSTESLQNYILGYGGFAVVLFIALQVVQVIVPILPGGISTIAGMLMFGAVYGMVYSYVGLAVGEVLAYFMVRHYGRGLLQVILSEKTYQKLDKMLVKGHDNITKLMVATFLIPFAPDDLVCFIAGLSNMDFKRYLLVVLTLKPISIGIYSWLVLYVVEQLIH